VATTIVSSASASQTMQNGDAVTMTATCPAGKTLMAGGGQISAGSVSKVFIAQSYPSSSTAWTVVAVSTANAPSTVVTAYAMCAN
jgi:hypothetical protein